MNWIDRKVFDVRKWEEFREKVFAKFPDLIARIKETVKADIVNINSQLGEFEKILSLVDDDENRIDVELIDREITSSLVLDRESLELVCLVSHYQTSYQFDINDADELYLRLDERMQSDEEVSRKLLEPLIDAHFDPRGAMYF